MLKLSRVIKEGLKIKEARNKGEQKKVRERKATNRITTSPLKPESLPPATGTKPAEQVSPVSTIVPPSPKAKKIDKKRALISLVKKEMEALELITDEDEKVYRIGNLATLSFKELEGYNPVMAAAKVREAIKESLLKKYALEPEGLEENLEDFKKKFRAFGTHCYIHTLREKM